MQAALDLAQVGVEDLGQRTQLAQRQISHLSLRPDEAAQLAPLGSGGD